MAQTKKKRRRKHRGTPAGTIERAGRTGQPKTREEGKRLARERRQQRLDKPPTWRGAINRAAIAAVVFAVLVVLLFRKTPGLALSVGVFMFVLYIPLGYATDMAIYRFRARRRAAAPPSTRRK